MVNKPQWPAWIAIVSSSTTNEHCNELLLHVRALRHHLDSTNQKTMPKQKCLELFEAIEALAVKIHAGPEFEKVETRLRDEVHTMHDDLVKKLSADSQKIGKG